MKDQVSLSYSEHSTMARGPKDWFRKQVVGQRKLYERDLKKGVVDKGYLWASLYLQIFVEGVFTLRYVPNQVEVGIPGGKFILTAVPEDGKVYWLIRNDKFGVIAKADPEMVANWAVENYPDGIDSDGYLYIVHMLLSTGAKTDVEKDTIWEQMFYDEIA